VLYFSHISIYTKYIIGDIMNLNEALQYALQNMHTWTFEQHEAFRVGTDIYIDFLQKVINEPENITLETNND
jgi:hypothetical protein